MKKERRLAIQWGITFLIIFPVLIILGLILNIGQGELMKLLLKNFYALMTLHGLGMAGILFSMSLAAIWYLISSRFIQLNIRIGNILYYITLTGFIGLTAGTLLGKLGSGWNILYPLTFKDPTWYSWSIPVSVLSLILMCIAWLIASFHILFSLVKYYGGFFKILGWNYFKKPKTENMPPIVLISSISLIAGIIGILIGMALLIIYFFQSFEKVLSFDSWLLKNMGTFFGDTILLVTLFNLSTIVYCLMPGITRRKWKVNRLMVISWNFTFFLFLLACFFHIFLALPHSFYIQLLGDITSNLIAIPALVITIQGVFLQVYKSSIKWKIVPLLLLFGVGGWAIGSFTTLINSSYAMNQVLNDTLWVPAEFHSFSLLGFVLFILAFLMQLLANEKTQKRFEKVTKTGFWIFILGSCGFLLLLFIGGINSIPRAYARYTGMGIKSMHTMSVSLAQLSVFFIVLILAGLLMMYISLFARLRRET